MNLKLFSFFKHPAPCDNFSTIFLNLSLNAVYPYFMRLKSFELLCMNENSDPNVISVAKKKKNNLRTLDSKASLYAKLLREA